MRTTVDINENTLQVINQICLQQDKTQDQIINQVLTDYVAVHNPSDFFVKEKVKSSEELHKMSFLEMMDTCPLKGIDLNVGNDRHVHPHREVDFS